jgi:predicted ribosomally synthesized peptide with nif11-like leader
MGVPPDGGGAFHREAGRMPLCWPSTMTLDQLKAFLLRMQQDDGLKQQVLSAATADDVAQIGLKLGYEFSGDELLRASGQRFERVTVRKNDIPGEYN